MSLIFEAIVGYARSREYKSPTSSEPWSGRAKDYTAADLRDPAKLTAFVEMYLREVRPLYQVRVKRSKWVSDGDHR